MGGQAVSARMQLEVLAAAICKRGPVGCMHHWRPLYVPAQFEWDLSLSFGPAAARLSEWALQRGGAHR